MLKRLLIAVFVLGLFLTLSGTAFSDVVKGPLNPVVKVNPNNARFNSILDARPAQSAFKKPASAIHKLDPGLSIPSPPLQYFCDETDYTSGSPAYFWTIPDAYGDDLDNMRFTSNTGFNDTLKVAWLLMYGSVMTGTPDMRVYLWDDDGFGFPGNKLDSVDIPYASLPTSGLGWVGADFSAANWVFSDGAEYHYGFTVLQSGPADTIAVISDAADGPHVGEERASENYAGTWGTMLNDWGDDVSFFITSEYCAGEIPFSDCYSQSYATNLAYLWRAPEPTYGDEAYSMRFDVGGPETLTTVELPIYDAGDGTFGNDDVIVTIYDDDGAGLPGPNILAQVTLPAGTYPAFPTYASVPFNVVIDQTFHVAFSSSATVDNEATLSSDGTDGTGRSASYWAGGPWVDMLNGWGNDVNFDFTANLCRDEYSLCSTNSYYDGLAYVWTLPDRYGDVANAVRVTSVGQQCRVQHVSWALYDNGDPNAYTTNSKVSVYSDAGGLPGSELASITLTPTDYVLYPGLTTVDFTPLDVYISGDYWVAIESFGTDTTDGIRTLSDDGSTPQGERSAESWGPGAWGTMLADWGVDFDFVAYSEHCCIPFAEATCDPANDPGWSTFQGNQARTGASELAVGDAWCNLNLNWSYLDPTQGVNMTGPAIYGDKAVCSFTDHYVVFNIADGTVAYTLDNTFGDGQLLGGDIRNTPSIVNINIGGTPTDVMFISGGSSNGIGAVDFNTGALIWQRTIYTVGPTQMFGQTRFATFTVLPIGGMDVLFYSTESGKVAAVDAATGTLFNETNYPGIGWPDANNPVILTASTYISGATDGTQLFYSTQTASTEGDVYAIDAATGAINWTLSSSGGLQAQNIYASYNYPEGFRGGVAYFQGNLYAVSWANSGGASDFPTDGVYYTISAADGSLPLPASACPRAIYNTPIVDLNRVFCPTLSQWVNADIGGNLIAFNRNTGNVDWKAITEDNAKYYTNGFRTCEPGGVDDLLFLFNENGFLECYNSVNGTQIFRRRIDHGGGAGNIGMAGAIAMANGELHILFADYYGGLYDFTKGADRPRLQVVSYHPSVPVDFGSNPALAIDFGPIAENTGCTDLHFNNVLVDENPISGSTLPDFSAGFVRDNVMATASKIADNLARDAFLSKFQRVDNNLITTDGITSVRDINRTKETRNLSAGVPAWLVSVDHPTAGDVIPAGGSMDLQFTVNQTIINRGPQTAYIDFDTDDPDFFLNGGTDGAGLLPEIQLTVIGGCLIDTTTLTFGVGQANSQLVSNTGRLGDGDWTPSYGFDIDGDGTSYYQGSYIYGVDKYRLAMNTKDWTSGGGEADSYISLQADPNYCDHVCKPHLDADVVVGKITGDGGLTYSDMLADVVCKSWLDSVQNFEQVPGDASTWDWTVFGGPFDDTLTMGLYVNSEVVGVKDVPQLANLTLEIMHFTNRSAVDSVKNWYIGHMFDCDNGGDTVAIDRSISTAWTYNQPGADQALGSIKIPFGCGDASNGDWDFNPVRNIKGLYGDAAFWNGTAYYDSAYIYLSNAPGLYAQNMGAGDAEAHITFGGHNFAPDGTYSMGVANFLVHGLTDATSSAELAPTAILVNKWAGFGRGDVNDDGKIDLADIIYLAAFVNNGGPGPIPFQHLGDVNADGNTDAADIDYMMNYYFQCGPCPMGAWMF